MSNNILVYWWSKKLKKKLRKKECIWHKHGTPQSWYSLMQMRNEYNRLLLRTKIDAISTKVSECETDTKKLYNLIRYITGTTTSNPLPPSSSDEKLANEFADYFMNKIQSIRDSLDTHSKYSAPPGNAWNFSAFEPLSTSDVTEIILGMKTKSCGIDPIPMKLIKEILPSVIEPITKIVNTSLQQGIFSKHWKTAVIRPLLKKIGLELTTSKYRQVSNLTFLSKVVQKVALNQLVAHFDNNNLMPDYQSAYRANQSCETVILKIVNDSLWAMENEYVTAMVTIDLSGAFNTVDHDILLNTLHCKFGIIDNAIEWVHSYLRPRSCKVNIKNSYSSARQLNFSIPQGSVAGPVLYLAYANTLEEVVQKGNAQKKSIYSMEHKISKGYRLI